MSSFATADTVVAGGESALDLIDPGAAVPRDWTCDIILELIFF